MATQIWTGAADRKFSTGGNWVSGTAPTGTATDSAHFTRRCRFACIEGLGQAGVDLLELVITPEYQPQEDPVTIGTDGSFLILSSDFCSIETDGNVYINSGAATAAVLDECNIYRGNVWLAFQGDTMADLRVFGGTVKCVEPGGAFATITDLVVAGETASIDLGSTIKGAVYDVTTACISDGNVVAGSVITDLWMTGGNLILAGRPTEGQFTTAHVFGGTVSTLTQETLPTLNLWGGTFTAEDLAESATLTTLNLFGGRAVIQPRTGNLTITNLNIKGQEYELLIDPGQKVTIANQ